MEFQLANRDRIGMLMIGAHMFTYDEPGPIDIEVDRMDPNERSQLLYNVRRGALACGNFKRLVELCEGSWSASAGFATPHESPIGGKSVGGQDIIEEDQGPLKDILRKSVSTAAREARSLPPGRIRKLLDLETQDKNRKGLKRALSALLEKHSKKVMKSVGENDVGGQLNSIGIQEIGSPNITDVVESNMKQIVLNPLKD